MRERNGDADGGSRERAREDVRRIMRSANHGERAHRERGGLEPDEDDPTPRIVRMAQPIREREGGRRGDGSRRVHGPEALVRVGRLLARVGHVRIEDERRASLGEELYDLRETLREERGLEREHHVLRPHVRRAAMSR